MKIRPFQILIVFAILGTVGCHQNQQSSVVPMSNTPPPVTSQPVAPSTGNESGDAPGQWGAFNEVLRSGGIYKNSTGKYLKITFEPLADSMDAVFADAPSGSVTITNASGDRTQGKFSLERDRTLTITLSAGKGKKMVFDLSKDGHTMSQIGGGQSLKLQP